MLTTPAQTSPSPDGAGNGVQPGAVATGAWRRSAVSALVAWITSHVAYGIVNVLNWPVGGPPAPGSTLLSAWLKWDAWHYWRIADGGYGQYPQDAAFFPFYPMLIRATDSVLPGDLLVAALAVSNVAGFGALMMLHRLTSDEFGERTADRTIFYLVAFPTAYFLAAPYNHSLFLVLVVGFLYAVRRGHWWLAGGLGALASGTRSAGVLLVLPFAYEYLRRQEFRVRRVRLDAAAVALVPAGLVAFAVYCWYSLGDALAFSHAQSYWHKTLDWPGHTLWLAATQLNDGPWLDRYMIVMDFASTLLFAGLLILCVVGPWKMRRDQRYLVVYAAPILLLPLFFPLTQGSPINSAARYVLDLAPAFIILGRMGANRYFDRIYPMPAIALQCMFLVMFMHYTWTF